MGFGVVANREGTNLMSGATDQIGAGFGFALAKSVTLGAKYNHTLGQSGLGDLGATLNFNPAAGKGIALGLGYTRDLAASTHGANAAIGYSFMGNNNIELDVDFPSLNSFSNFNLSALFTMQKQMIYLGGGYLMINSGGMTHGAVGRLGFVLGGSVDFSIWGRHFFVASAPIEYGGSLRAAF